MTVSNTSPLVENKTGNGVWTTISVTPGQILQNSDGTHAIKVIKTTIADGTTVTLAETTDYTVTLDGTSPSTGTVTLVAGAPSSAYRYTVLSNITPKQEVNLQNGTIVDMEDIEAALDRLTLYAHKQDEKLERAVVLSEDTLTRDLTIDSLDSQAGKVLRVNATEDGFDYVDVTDGISQATFDINALTAIDSVVTSTDKLPIYDVSTGLTKYVVPDNLGLVTSSGLKGNVQQIQYVTKTDTFSQAVAAANTWYDVTGLSVTITPSSARSKLLIGGFLNFTGTGPAFRIVKDSAMIDPKPITAGLAIKGHGIDQHGVSTLATSPISFLYLIDAETTQAQSIKIQVTETSAATCYVNRSGTDTDSVEYGRTASHLYVMEILDPINPTGIVANYSFTADTTVATSLTTYATSAQVPIPGNHSTIKVVPIADTSYNVLFINTSAYVGSAVNPKGNILKNSSNFLSATSPSNRLNILSQVGGTSSSSHLCWAGTEALSSASICRYEATIGATASTLTHGGTATTGVATSRIYPSYSLGVNFVTTGSSTFKQHTTSTLTTTETSSSLTGGNFHTPTLSTTITPTSSSNYLWVIGNVIVGQDDGASGDGIYFKLTRDGSDLFVGDAASNRIRTMFHSRNGNDATVSNFPFTCILPATSTSSTTIGCKVGPDASVATTCYVNRSFTDTDSTTYMRGVSQISVIEIDPIA